VCAVVLISGLDNSIYTEHYPGFRCLEISQHDIGYPCEQYSGQKCAARPPTTGFSFDFFSTFPRSKADCRNHNPPLTHVLPRLVKKFPSFYGIQIFIIVLWSCALRQCAICKMSSTRDLKMEKVCSSENPDSTHQTTRRHHQQEHNINLNSSKKLEFYSLNYHKQNSPPLFLVMDQTNPVTTLHLPS